LGLLGVVEFNDNKIESMATNIGKITQVIGPVIDISFDLEGSEQDL